MSIFSPKFVCFFLVVVVSIPSSIFDSISRLKSRSIVRAVRPSVAAAMRASIFLLFSPCLKVISARLISEFWLNFKKVIIGGRERWEEQAIRHCGTTAANCCSQLVPSTFSHLLR